MSKPIAIAYCPTCGWTRRTDEPIDAPDSTGPIDAPDSIESTDSIDSAERDDAAAPDEASVELNRAMIDHYVETGHSPVERCSLEEWVERLERREP